MDEDVLHRFDRTAHGTLTAFCHRLDVCPVMTYFEDVVEGFV